MNQWIECRQQLMLVRVHHVKGTSSVTFVYEGDLSATTATAIAKFNSRSSGKQPVLRLNLARAFSGREFVGVGLTVAEVND